MAYKDLTSLQTPEYKASTFMDVGKDLPGGITQKNLLALAYIKGERDRVVKKGFSNLSSFDGVHRCGKSMSAITFAYLWDPTFWPNFEKRIIRDHKDFIDSMENIAKHKIHGAINIVDEAGVSMSSSDWYERWLKTITKMVQMFGYLHPVIFFVAPIKEFVDSRLRKMFHNYYKVDRYNNEYSCITPYKVKFNTIYNKHIYKKPIIRIGNQNITLSRIILGKPPAKLLDRYINLENQRKDIMFTKFVDEIKKDETREQKKEVDIEEVVKHVVAQKQIFLADRSKPTEPKLDIGQLEFGLKIPHRLAKYVKTRAERILREQQKEEAEQEQSAENTEEKKLEKKGVSVVTKTKKEENYEPGS